jgi:hypothetical protein
MPKEEKKEIWKSFGISVMWAKIQNTLQNTRNVEVKELPVLM